MIKKIERGLWVAETTLLVGALSFMIFLSFLQVILRNFFHSGILWADPLLRHLVVWIGFLGAAFAAAQGKHFAWEAPLKNKALSQALSIFSNFSGAVVSFLLALASRQYEGEEAKFGRSLFQIGRVQIPSWVSAEIVMAGFILIGLHFLLKTISPAPPRELDTL